MSRPSPSILTLPCRPHNFPALPLRLTSKNADLVRSYWPLMTRLKEAEADAAAARQQAAEDRAAVEAAAAEAAALRQANEAMEALAAENRAMREEQESHELEVRVACLLNFVRLSVCWTACVCWRAHRDGLRYGITAALVRRSMKHDMCMATPQRRREQQMFRPL